MSPHSIVTRSTAPSERQPNTLHVFVLIDALGWQCLQGRPFLQDILPYRRPLRTVLGFSSGAIPTILTGTWPSENGHWNLFYYDPAGSPFRWLRYFSWLPDALLNSRVGSKILKELGRHVLGVGPLFDCAVKPSLLRWFNYAERRDIYEPNGISGRDSIFDQLIERGIPYHSYTYHQETDAQIVEHVLRDMETSPSHFYFLYLSEMDMFLHMKCQQPQQIDEKLAWYDDRLRKIFACARALDPDATMTVFSDHGMTPVNRHYDLMKDIECLPYQMPADYLVVYDSTMARFWFFSDQARIQITQVLKESSCGRIVSETELRELGVWFADSRYGELVFLLRPGWLLARSDFNGPQWMPFGMHGYHPDDPYSDAVFLSSCQPRSEPHTIADVYGRMRDTFV
jgi:hypothetical protein